MTLMSVERCIEKGKTSEGNRHFSKHSFKTYQGCSISKFPHHVNHEQKTVPS